jgi:hypothetical protein
MPSLRGIVCALLWVQVEVSRYGHYNWINVKNLPV